MRTFAIVLTLLCLSLASTSSSAAEFSVKQEDNGDIAILIDGELFTRYVTSDSETNKCYFWPIIGPDGIAMTRAYPMQDVPGEMQDHPHHRSVFFGMEHAGDANTWHELATFTKDGKVNQQRAATLGKQVHTKVLQADANGNFATLIVQCDNQNSEGDAFLIETRIARFHVTSDQSRVMDFEIILTAVAPSVLIEDRKDSGLSVRVAHTMCIDAKKGGTIVNSAGDLDKDAWGKRAAWVDFNGPVQEKRMGIAMLNHPTSFRHPTPWHVRSYGLFTANPFALKQVAGEKESGNVELKQGQSIELRHRLIFHSGDHKAANIEKAWDEYAKLKPLDLSRVDQPENEPALSR